MRRGRDPWEAEGIFKIERLEYDQILLTETPSREKDTNRWDRRESLWNCPKVNFLQRVPVKINEQINSFTKI